MKTLKMLILIIFVPILLSAQDDPKFGIKFSGFVKTDVFYDTRQVVSIREGHFLLYPDNVMNDQDGIDINDASSFNILSIQTRLKGAITGPDAFGAKTSGLIEADFFGNENSNFQDVNGFRIRHAYVQLTWRKFELIAGQYWHPMFVAESFPSVLSFNTGAPFQPFSRNPQVRFTYKAGNFNTILTAFSQRDFQGAGPDGSSSKYLRNSGIPNLNLQFQYKLKDSEHMAVAGVDYKVIKPELYTSNVGLTKKFATNTTIASYSAFASLKLKFKPLTFKLYGVYAQNATDLTMIGGYAVSSINDIVTGDKTYCNMNTMSVWTELMTNGKKVKFAVFGGYSKNLGATDSINSGIMYGRGLNIDYLYRVAPRVEFISGKFNTGLECEYTTAYFGKQNGDYEGGVTGSKAITNIRIMLSFIYNF